MKYFRQTLLLIVASCFVVSCRHTGIVDGVAVKLVSPEKVVSMKRDTAFRYSFPEVLYCYGIQIVDDTVLVFHDQISENSPCHFKAYSTESFEYLGSFIRNGRGPGEMIYPRIIKSDGMKPYLDVDAGQMGKAFVVDVEESIKTKKAAIVQSYDLPPNVICWIPMEDGKQFIWQLENKESVFCLTGQDGDEIKKFHLYKHIDGERYATHLSSALACNSGNGRVAESMVLFPQINIIDTESGQVQSIAVDRSYWKWETVLNSMLGPDSIQYYAGIASTSEYIIALYKGRSLCELQETGAGTSIHVFDWDGNFICDISVSENIGDMAYDGRTGYLYCSDNISGRIIRYDMSGILD